MFEDLYRSSYIGVPSRPFAKAMAVMGHLPCFEHPILLAAMVRRDLIIHGAYPMPSTP